MAALTLTAITPEIVLVKFDDSKSLAAAMVRFQEYYESPFDDIRGKVFTLGYVLSKGGRDNKDINTYLGGTFHPPDWAGYNFPSYVLEPFIRGLFDPLTKYEMDIVNALRYRSDRFYVIGVSKEDGDAIEHELCHALYYVSPKYKSAVDKLLSKVDLTELKDELRDMGYCEEVLDDECQAYMSADAGWLYDTFDIEIDKRVVKRLRSLKNKYLKELKVGL